jgi:hypothetical protein
MLQPTAVNGDKSHNSWGSDPRFTALPVKDVLKIRIKDLGLRNADLQKALGYPMPNVISMMKTGSMNLPASKVLITAKMLKVDPVFLLRKVISENDPALWDSISAVLDQHLVTKNELALLRYVRYHLDGHDVNLAEAPGFLQAADPVLAVIKAAETALATAAIERNDDHE